MSAALVALALGAGPVLASAPNDHVSSATVLAIPASISQDTTVANTSDPDEVALNDFCGAPVVEHGVWFSVTPLAAATYAFDTSKSDYSAGIMLFEGAPSGPSLLDCGPGVIVDDLEASVTYNLLVFGDGLTEATAGDLELSTRVATPAPDVEFTVNRSGSVDKAGTVHISGTATCTSANGSGQVIEIFGDVTQRVGRLLIRGFFDTSPSTPCDGTPQRWDAFFTGDNGIFAGGKAITANFGIGCTDLCSESFFAATIQLNRNGK